MDAIRASMRRFQVTGSPHVEGDAALRALVEAVRVSLSNEVDQDVEEKDFNAVVPINLPSRQARRFQASEFAPAVYRRFRRCAHVTAAELRASLCDAKLPARDMSSQGRSGAHFYRTEDGKFLIKCLNRTDVKALRGLLSDLYEHITKPPSTSLLAPPLALFKVDHQFPKSVAFPAKFFLITRHIAPDARLILDLKGCLLHRRATAASLRNPDSAYHVLKDRDILESRAQLVLSVALRSPLLSQLSDDLEFLKDRGIIDYSLLLAMTTTGKKRAEKRTEEAKAEAHRVLIKSEWEVIEEEEEVVMRHAKEEGEEVEQEQAEKDVIMEVEEEGAKEAEAEIQHDAEDMEKEAEGTEENEAEDNIAGMPVRLRINSFVNSTLAKPHAVLQDLSDVNPGSLRLQVNIIDYLTHYGVYHRMSGFVKHLRYGANVSMSTEPPTQYRFRLQAFAEHVITSM